MNATLTLAALVSGSAREGFLTPQTQPQGHQIPLRLPDGSVGTVMLVPYERLL